MVHFMKSVKLKILFALLLAGLFSACIKTPPIQPVATAATTKLYAWTDFAMGADISFSYQLQDDGAVYKDSNKITDPFIIFKNQGTNTVRVRLWHNPQWLAPFNAGKLYNDLNDVTKTIQRAKAAGMAVNLDIHYSDTWADPANQTTPAAWMRLGLTDLKDSLYNYTFAVLTNLKNNNCTPEMIQIGNETNQGIPWTLGKVVNNDYSAFAAVLNSGIKAVRDFSANSNVKPQIILHVAGLENAGYFTTQLIAAGVTDFDIIGVSHYSQRSTINDMAGIKNSIASLKSGFGKNVMIVETAYPFTTAFADNYTNIIDAATAVVPGYTITHDGQYKYMKDLTQAVISGGGKGVMYWAPDWISCNYRDQ
jgi:arabinogalactan endo-1,4-beta-galactosidase